MDGRDQENLIELFEEFFDAEQAQNCLENIQRAERILREHPAPEPDDMLIANIKAEMAMRLRPRRASVFRRMVYRAAAVAAAVIILTAISVKLFENGVEPAAFQRASLLPSAIWESDDIATDDVNLAIFTAEIEQIENEVLTLQSGEDSSHGDGTIVELEVELIEISSDFWKG